MALSGSDITLFWGSGSAPCWRVLLTLEEKEVKGYTSKMLSFEKKEHKGPEVLQYNPRGQLPTCKIGDHIVNESIAACDFLESLFPSQGTKLIPDDVAIRAVVLQRKYEALNVIKKGMEDLLVYLIKTKPQYHDKNLVKMKKQALFDELKLWEGYISQLGDGSHIAGPDFTMADIIFFPAVAFLVRMGLQLNGNFPKLAAYYKKVEERPAVKATWPPHWKGSSNQNFLEQLILPAEDPQPEENSKPAEKPKEE